MSKFDQLIGAIRTPALHHLMQMFFPNEHFFEKEIPRFYPLPSTNFLRWVEHHLEWRRRGNLEENPTFKQVIPYIVLYYWPDTEIHWVGADHANPKVHLFGKVFVMRRLEGCDEPALVGKTSIGVGGHLEIDDVRSGASIDYGARRELLEEIEFGGDAPLDPKFMGVIAGGSQLVDQVHVGMVYRLDLGPNTHCAVRETDVLKGWWVEAKNLHTVSGLELWSSALVPHLDTILSW